METLRKRWEIIAAMGPEWKSLLIASVSALPFSAFSPALSALATVVILTLISIHVIKFSQPSLCDAVGRHYRASFCNHPR